MGCRETRRTNANMERAGGPKHVQTCYGSRGAGTTPFTAGRSRAGASSDTATPQHEAPGHASFRHGGRHLRGPPSRESPVSGGGRRGGRILSNSSTSSSGHRRPAAPWSLDVRTRVSRTGAPRPPGPGSPAGRHLEGSFRFCQVGRACGSSPGALVPPLLSHGAQTPPPCAPRLTVAGLRSQPRRRTCEVTVTYGFTPSPAGSEMTILGGRKVRVLGSQRCHRCGEPFPRPSVRPQGFSLVNDAAAASEASMSPGGGRSPPGAEHLHAE